MIGAPAATPPEVVEKLSGCFEQVAADPEFQKAAKERTLLMNPMNGKQTAEWVAKESAILKELWESDPWINSSSRGRSRAATGVEATGSGSVLPFRGSRTRLTAFSAAGAPRGASIR